MGGTGAELSPSQREGPVPYGQDEEVRDPSLVKQARAGKVNQ